MTAKCSFKQMLKQQGCSERAIEELWKWFDVSEKMGVASF
jgi:hypothetical protein